jgi:hypothetical protein
VSCPTGTRCTAVGASSFDKNTKLLAEDLNGGRWTASAPSNKTVAPGNLGLRSVSCSAPRVCTAMVHYISNDSLTWAFASRGGTGGWRFQIPAGFVAFDTTQDLSCAPGGRCMLAGGKGDTDGRGGNFDTGSTLAWRGSGTSFAPVATPPPPVTVGSERAGRRNR